MLARFAMFVPVTLVGLFLLLHTYGGFRKVRIETAEHPVAEPPAEETRAPALAGRR